MSHRRRQGNGRQELESMGEKQWPMEKYFTTLAPAVALSDLQEFGTVQVPVSQEGTLQAVPPLPRG